MTKNVNTIEEFINEYNASTDFVLVLNGIAITCHSIKLIGNTLFCYFVVPAFEYLGKYTVCSINRKNIVSLFGADCYFKVVD